MIDDKNKYRAITDRKSSLRLIIKIKNYFFYLLIKIIYR